MRDGAYALQRVQSECGVFFLGRADAQSVKASAISCVAGEFEEGGNPDAALSIFKTGGDCDRESAASRFEVFEKPSCFFRVHGSLVKTLSPLSLIFPSLSENSKSDGRGASEKPEKRRFSF